MTEKPCISFKLKRKSGRSWIITPDGREPVFVKVLIDNALLRAFARACLWDRELESGKYESMQDLARRNKISEPYVRRILSLNLLSPKIQMAIMDGTFPRFHKLQNIIYDIPLSWPDQEAKWLKN